MDLLLDCWNIPALASKDETRPIVFIGPFEHHSNLIPWREAGCTIVMIPACPVSGDVDFGVLEQKLQQRTTSTTTALTIGTFSAASNVTGRVSDVDRIAALLHRYHAKACFDYATAAAYTPLNMNPTTTTSSAGAAIYKDAMFLSPHKVLGGPGTPGVLVVKRDGVSTSQVPRRSAGGGTVFYVTHTDHRFLSHRVERYEGGTPNVTGIVRCGLTFLLKRHVETEYKRIVEGEKSNDTTTAPASLYAWDCQTRSRAVAYLRQHAPNLVVLDDGSQQQSTHLPILSFLIRFGPRFLHYNYVCAILNDLFGIQSRGGCQCAGPYSQSLLGLTTRTRSNGQGVEEEEEEEEQPNERNRSIELALYQHKERAELLRPGYSRLSLPFKGLRDVEVDYVLQALVWVAQNGWALLCQYRCNHRTGEWRHASRQGKPLGQHGRKWLGQYRMGAASSPVNDRDDDDDVKTTTLESVLQQTMRNADAILAMTKTDRRSIAEANKTVSPEDILGDMEDDHIEQLRWYAYPKDCATLLVNNQEPDNTVTLVGALSPGSAVAASDMTRGADSMEEDKDATTKKRKHAPAQIDRCGTTAAADGSKMVRFRDGEHCGEATLHEIMEGSDDGELSENCEIYCSERGSWFSLANYRRNTADDESTAAAAAAAAAVEEVAVKHKAITRARAPPPIAPTVKKAARGREVWGQRQPLSGPPSLLNQAGELTTMPPSAPNEKPRKRKRFLHIQPPPKLMKLATQAIMQWNMIEEGDRLLLGLSGGKDSLSLLHCLMEFKRKLRTNFEIEVCTIDPMTPSFDPSPLIPYVESLGLKYHYIKEDIVERANNAGKDGKMVTSLCAYCARMKRGTLYTCARENKCNKLVLAQHLDDCVESTMMVSVLQQVAFAFD